jgi:phage terminase large subunit-like protein
VTGAERPKLEAAIAKAGGRAAFAALVRALPAAEQVRLSFRWDLFARPSQLPPPGAWRTWLALSGRGWGKTKTGSEWVRGEVEAGCARRIALIAPTASAARDVLIEGESGIMACSPPWARPVYEPSKRRLTWPGGAQATTYSADEPDRLRGPQFDLALCDELASYFDPTAVWDMLQMGLRIGERPRALVTTTPRPIPLIRRLMADPSVTVTRGTTFDNASNLAPGFLDAIRASYEGTRLGRQEIHAEILDDNPDALWRLTDIEGSRVKVAPVLRRICVGVDPAVTANKNSDETGIVVAGVGDCACRGRVERHAFVLDDRSGVYSPAAWARAVQVAFERWRADRVIAEVNQGGDLVEANLRANGWERVPFKKIHASKGKQLRAEPVAALYEQGKVHHVGNFARLEDQQTSWNPTQDATSPDRVDALCYVVTELLLSGSTAPRYLGSLSALTAKMGGRPWRSRES